MFSKFVFSFITNAFDVASFSRVQLIPCSPAGFDFFICDFITLGILAGTAYFWHWVYCPPNSESCEPEQIAWIAFELSLALR
jgi:hypothetical protein